MTREELFTYMMEEVRKLEIAYGNDPDKKWDINAQPVQKRLKWTYSCFCEEMSELYEAIFIYPQTDALYIEAMYDELVDSGNFLISFLLFSGRKNLPKICEGIITASRRDYLQTLGYQSITELGLTCNFLKDRPWKKEHSVVDKTAFNNMLDKAIHTFTAYSYIVAPHTEMYKEAFDRKLQKNYKRLQSNY